MCVFTFLNLFIFTILPSTIMMKKGKKSLRPQNIALLNPFSFVQGENRFCMEKGISSTFQCVVLSFLFLSWFVKKRTKMTSGCVLDFVSKFGFKLWPNQIDTLMIDEWYGY